MVQLKKRKRTYDRKDHLETVYHKQYKQHIPYLLFLLSVVPLSILSLLIVLYLTNIKFIFFKVENVIDIISMTLALSYVAYRYTVDIRKYDWQKLPVINWLNNLKKEYFL